MSRKQQILGLSIVLAFAVVLGYAGLRMTRQGTPVCQACSRSVHKNMRTVALIGDKRELFCCPTCALSAGAQLHERVSIQEVSDFSTGKMLRPASAFAVEGSDVIPCFHHHEILDRDRQPARADFDRCSPSIIAFDSRPPAEHFAAEHGGRVDRFSALFAHADAHAIP